MSYGIIRIAKVTTGAIGGAQIHNERKSDHSNTNPDIDFSRSENNRQLPLEKGYLEQLPYHKRISEVLRTERKDTKTIRKDAVKMCEVLVTSAASFFDALTPGQTKDFFDTAYAFLCDRYGRKNMIAATVHMDERTPHMHVDFVPVTKDGRLSAKDVVGFQKDLSRLHDDFFQQVGKRYGLERGQKATETGEKKYNLTVTEFKAETAAAGRALEAARSMTPVKTREIPLTGSIVVTKDDWKRIQEENKAARIVFAGKKTMEKEKTTWVNQKASLDEDTKTVRSELLSLSSQKISLQKEVKNLSTNKVALTAALTRQKTAWQQEQETLSVQQLGIGYRALLSSVSGLKSKSELLADQIRSQSSEIGENENFLDGQSEKFTAISLQLQSVKKETSEKEALLKGITQELAEQMDKYEMPIEKRMEENSWRKKHDELRKFINQEVIPRTGLNLFGMFEAYQKKQKDLQQDERSR
jgi:hypothetical protein